MRRRRVQPARSGRVSASHANGGVVSLDPNQLDQIRAAIVEFRTRLEGLEEDVHEIRNLAMRVGENTATLNVLLKASSEVSGEISKLREDFNTKLKELTDAERRAPNWKTLVTFASTVVVPILLALIGGYFALKGAQVAPGGK